MKALERFLLWIAIVGLSACASIDTRKDKEFVTSWAAGHINPMAKNIAQYNNQTLREVVRLSAGGEFVRVRIANTFGTSPLSIGEAHVATSESGSRIVAGSDRILTFGGQRSVKVMAGAPVLSDPLRIDVKPLT